MIQINKITPPSVILYNPQGEYMGVVNEYEFTDICAQIAENKEEGYSIEFKGEVVKIDKKGNLEKWPSTLFIEIMENMARKFKANINDTSNNK